MFGWRNERWMRNPIVIVVFQVAWFALAVGIFMIVT